MGYAFLWLEAMASALLLVAVVFACSGRIKKWPSLWPILTACLLAVLGIATSLFSGYLFFENIHPQWLFPYTLTWTLFFIIGCWFLIRRGRQKAGEVLSAASWSRSKIAGALVIAFFLQWSTVTALDNTAKLEAAAIQTMTLNRAQTILPSTPPQDENAAEIYTQAKEEMGEVPEWLWNSVTDPAFDPKSKKAQTLLRKNKKSIATIKKAVQKPRLYYPLLISYDFEVPQISTARNASRLLALEARALAQNGRMDAALANVSDINKIAEHVNQTPMLVSVLIASVTHVEAKRTLEIILSEKPTRSKIRTTLPVEPNDHILQSFRTGMKFENYMNAFGMGALLIKDQSFEDVYWSSFDDEPEDVWQAFVVEHFGAPLYRIFLYPDDRISREQFWNSFHEYISKPYYQSGSNLKEWLDHLDENIDLGFPMAVNPFPVGNYFERVTHQQTQFVLGRLGLASAVYHSDHGKYPASLDTLVPKYITEVPKDPFNGEPLKMIAVKDGLILYGVGNDLKDNQGAAYDRKTEEGDIAFYLGSAFKKHRLKPILEAKKNVKTE